MFCLLKPTVWLVGGFVVGASCVLCHFGSRMHLLLFLWVYPFPIGLRPVFFTAHCGETCLPFRQNPLQQLCRFQQRQFLWRSLCRRHPECSPQKRSLVFLTVTSTSSLWTTCTTRIVLPLSIVLVLVSSLPNVNHSRPTAKFNSNTFGPHEDEHFVLWRQRTLPQ